MPVNYDALLRNLDRELLHPTGADRELEENLVSPFPQPSSTRLLRSLRFADEPELQVVAEGRLRLGRPNDPPYPAPVRSQGRAVRKVQQALIDLGYPLPRYGDDGRYGQEMYNAVLAYKRRFNIRTPSGYLDGIVGPKTIIHLDSNFASGPLPACAAPGVPVIAEGENAPPSPNSGIPWVTCDPLLAPGHDSPCDMVLPDAGEKQQTGGDLVVVPSAAQTYCVNKPHIHLEFNAWWEEMLPNQNRAANAPRYDVHFMGYSEENFIPGRPTPYKKDIVVTPGFDNLRFLTSRQKNRIFHVHYALQEHD